MPERLVDVVIPARGEEPYLAEAVASALAQPETAQVVIGTFAPDSATVRWVGAHEDPRVSYALSRHASAGANTEAGLTKTTAPFLAFLDADDRWPDGRLAPALRALVGPPPAGLCLGQQQAMDAAGKLLPHVAAAPLMSAAVATRETVERVGGFGTDLTAQMRWLLRARDLGVRVATLDEVVMHRRGHDANLSTVERPELHRAYLELARERARAARANASADRPGQG